MPFPFVSRNRESSLGSVVRPTRALAQPSAVIWDVRVVMGNPDAADARPGLVPVRDAGRVAGDVFTVRLGPYGSAVLADREQVR